MKHRLKQMLPEFALLSSIFIFFIIMGKNYFGEKYIWQVFLAVAILWVAKELLRTINYIIEGGTHE